MLPEQAIETLRQWFLQNRRKLPWRENPSPYSVWISEVMLQQTQSSRVIAYYQRWLDHFPSIEILAKATEEEVFKCWEGLGYYSRAKALHRAAQQICERFGGSLPSTQEELISIKGLGPYTSAAVAAFGFHQKAAAVDGNVVRVLSRLFEIQDDITKLKTQKYFRELAVTLLPEKEPWVVAESLIELGACVCRPKPQCESCPLQIHCKAYQNQTERALPFSSRKVKYETLFREVAVISCGEQLLLRQGKPGQACQGLFEFPYFECEEKGLTADIVQRRISQELGLEASFQMPLDEEKQSFTRFRVTLYPKLFEVQEPKPVDTCRWYTVEEIEKLTFSSGHKRVLASSSFRYL